MATRREEANVSLSSHESLPSEAMVTGYQESNASLPFNTIFTPDVMTPGDEETNNPSIPIVQPMQMGEDDPEGRELPRADGGKDAWLVLAGCFVLEALVWGYAIHPMLQLACFVEIKADNKTVSRGHSASSRTTTPPTSLSTATRQASPPSRQRLLASCSWPHLWWQFSVSDSHRADVVQTSLALLF